MKSTNFAYTGSLLIVGLGLAMNSQAATILVPQNKPTIAAGIAAANNGDTVAVSSGTYNEHNILITNGITVTSINGPTNTIIDSQHAGKGFIVSPPVSGTVTIVGFTIQNGQMPDYDGGGAVFVTSGNCVISKCIIQGVSGPADFTYGPINNNNAAATVLVDTCIVRNNFAANGAGIMACNVRNCWIYNNTGGNNCGALWTCNATNCTVYGNGGGYLPNPWTVGGANGGNYDNCIFWDNLPSYNNQELYQPTNVSYCIVEGGFSGTGNLGSDPLFVNAASGNFSLQAGSPAIGAGDPAILKPNGSRSDIGASGNINSGFPITGTISLQKAVKPSFSNLWLGTNYQLQVSADLINWTNQGSAFTATNANMVYPQYWDVGNWNSLFFRLQITP
jgi:hypothetical protein